MRKMCDNGVLPGIIHSISFSSAISKDYTIGATIRNGRNCKEKTFGKVLVSFDNFHSTQRVFSRLFPSSYS